MRWPIYVVTDEPGSLDLARLRARGIGGVGLTGGVACDPIRLRDAAASLEAAGLRLASVRVEADVARPDGAQLSAEVLEVLGRHAALLELSLGSSSPHDVPSAPRADARAVEVVKRFADAARAWRAALCPRRGAWLARIEDAVRLGMRINRPEVGLTLSYEDWADAPPERLEPRLILALPRAWTVAVGSLDGNEALLPVFLGHLAKHGYAGPVGVDADDLDRFIGVAAKGS